MDPALVDVNVHPAKLEVRFSKEAELMRLVERTLHDCLRRENLIPQMQTSAARKPDVVQERLPLYETSVRSQETAPKTDEGGKRDGGGQRPERAGSDKDAAGRGDRIAGGAEHPAVSERGRAQERNPFVADGSLRFSQTPVRINPDDASNLSPAEKRAARELYAPAGQAGEEARSGSSMPKLFPIGQMHGTYIIAQSEEALYLIDQHAAHERINYEYYYERFGQPEAAAQLLLMPITLEFTPAEAEALKPKLSLLMQVGVEMEHFGGGTFIVRSHPSWFPADQARAVIEEMAAWILEEQKPVDLAKLREKSAILCSCRSSVKANEPLTMAEMESLLDRLRACKQPYTCPHGRPVVISFSNYELQKMFKRIM
jgi:DNA mismatch repair protein MutL